MKRILVSQPQPASNKSPYYDLTNRFDVEVTFRSFIKVEGLTAREFRQHKVSIPDFTAILLTSKTAVDHFFRLCEETRYSVPDTLKYFCVNESIALYLQKYITYRKRKIFFSETGRPEDLVPVIQKHNKEKYMLPVSETFADDKANTLDEHGIQYTKAIMFRTVSNDFQPGEKLDYDIIIFFSPQGIKTLLNNFPDFVQGDIAIGAMGQNTIEAINEANLRLDITTSPEAPSMVAAIQQFILKKYPELEKED